MWKMMMNPWMLAGSLLDINWGGSLPSTPNARSAAVQAARIRFEQNKLASDSSKIDPSESVLQVGTLRASLPSSRRAVEKINEPDPDEKAAADEIAVIAEGSELDGREPHDNQNGRTEPDPDESKASVHASLPILRDGEPDLDDSQAKPDLQGSNTSGGVQEPDPNDTLTLSDWIKTVRQYTPTIVDAEPDPEESMSVREERNPDESTQREEPDPDESLHREEPDPDESVHREESDPDESLRRKEPDPDESMDSNEPDAHESWKSHENGLGLDVASVAAIRLQQAVVHIRQQATPAETTIALNTLSTILSNVVKDPNEGKFQVIRKINHRFQSHVGRFEGAVEFLRAVEYSEGEPAPGAGGSDCFVLKASDPRLLYLALNILQAHVA